MSEREISMKVSKVRDGEKFVLDDRGGVWEKVGVDVDGKAKARCFFGPRDVHGTEINIDPEAYCYVIFEGRPNPFGRDVDPATPIPARFSDNPPAVPHGFEVIAKIRIEDDSDDTLLKEIVDPTVGQLAIMSKMERIRFVPLGSSHVQVYNVSEFAYDVDENTLYLGVIPERGDQNDDERNHRD